MSDYPSTNYGTSDATCSECGDVIMHPWQGGWKRTAEGEDYLAHHGVCPSKADELWERIAIARLAYQNPDNEAAEGARIEAHVG